MKAVVLGGTTGMGRAIAQRLAARGDSVFLLGIGEEDLEKSATDLKARSTGGKAAGYAICDLEKPETFAKALDKADEALGKFDAVIVTAALFATQEALEADIELTRRLVQNSTETRRPLCRRQHARILVALSLGDVRASLEVQLESDLLDYVDADGNAALFAYHTKGSA